MTSSQVVFLTGASRGLGRALALEFARSGHVLMLTARNEDQLREVCSLIHKNGGVAEFIVCDVGDPEAVERAVTTTLATFGRIDIAVLNAGMSGHVRFSDLDRKLFNSILETNLEGVVNCMASLIPVMKRQGHGTIAGISSLGDVRPIPGTSPYVASKAALTVILEAAAMELKPLGIDVLTVRPGFITTDMTAENTLPMPQLMSPERAAKTIVRRVLKKRRIISFPFPLSAASVLSRIIPAAIWRYAFRVGR